MESFRKIPKEPWKEFSILSLEEFFTKKLISPIFSQIPVDIYQKSFKKFFKESLEKNRWVHRDFLCNSRRIFGRIFKPFLPWEISQRFLKKKNPRESLKNFYMEFLKKFPEEIVQEFFWVLNLKYFFYNLLMKSHNITIWDVLFLSKLFSEINNQMKISKKFTEFSKKYPKRILNNVVLSGLSKHWQTKFQKTLLISSFVTNLHKRNPWK